MDFHRLTAVSCVLVSIVTDLGCIGVAELPLKTQDSRNGNMLENSRPGRGIEIVFADTEGIYKHLATQDSTIKLIGNAKIDHKRVRLSPDGKQLAFRYQTDTLSKLAILNLLSNQVTEINSVPFTNILTFEWSDDSRMLGIGYYDPPDFYSNSKPKHGDVIVYNTRTNQAQSVGCSTGRIFHTFLPSGNMLIEGPDYAYLVDTSSCKTIFFFKTTGMRLLSVSPKKDKLLYLKDKAVFVERLGSIQNIPQLFVSDVDGRHETLVFGHQYRPNHPSWKPDGTAILCDVSTPEWTDERTIAIYNIADSTRWTLTEADPSIVWAPSWSADGTKVIYDRQIPPTSLAYEPIYFVRDKIVYDLLSHRHWSIRRVVDPSSTASVSWSGPPLGETWGWVENKYIVMVFPVGTWIYDLRGEVVDSIPLSRPIAVRLFQ